MQYRNAFMSLIELHINILSPPEKKGPGKVFATDLSGDLFYKDSGAHRVRVVCDVSPRMCIIEQYGLDSVLIYAYSDRTHRDEETKGSTKHYTMTQHGGLLNNLDTAQEALATMAKEVSSFLLAGTTLRNKIKIIGVTYAQIPG